MINVKNDIQDRVGESKVMNYGEIATIIEYNNSQDIIIQFTTTKEIVKTEYGSFKKDNRKKTK